MATTGIAHCSPYGLVCTECDELVIAPEWSEYVGKREVRHVWVCDNCGHELEMMVDLRSSAISKPSHSASLETQTACRA